MMLTKRLLPSIAIALLLLSLPAASSAQLMGLMTLERMSALDTWGTGAKAMGMGGAYTSISDDALGMVFNPAGIARVRNSEISIDDLPQEVRETALSIPRTVRSGESLKKVLSDVERQYLLMACRKYSTQTAVADALGLSQPTVARLMKKHDVRPGGQDTIHP